MRNRNILLTILPLVASISTFAQLTVNTPITLTGGAVLTVQDMDIITNANIEGNGTVLVNGNTTTNIQGNSNSVPNLTINKTSGDVNLASNLLVNNDLDLAGGKFILGANTASVSASSNITGSSSNYIVTNGTGVISKAVSSDLTNYLLPLGPSTTSYNPLAITTSGTYSSASLTARSEGSVHPNNPAGNNSYLNSYWPITRTGITGNMSATGTYIDPTGFTGTESQIQGAAYTSGVWNFSGNSINTTANSVTANIPSAGGDLYGTNVFLYVKAKAYLQGAYNTGTLDMRNQLNAVLPTTDPYRSAPYNTAFTHVNNPTPEVASSSVLTNSTAGGDRIVDWVFLELRDNATVGFPGRNVVATRAALIQKDGDIVDVDGISPVLFRNVPNSAGYTLAIRHRNHLGMSTDPSTNLLTFNADPANTTVDFTTMTNAQIFGTAVAYKVIGSVNTLWAGNSRHDAKVAFTGLNNDKDPINANLSTLGYYNTDVNMNGASLRTGLNNDKDFIFVQVLNNSILSANQRTQALP
jgi:hypothetical protein